MTGKSNLRAHLCALFIGLAVLVYATPGHSAQQFAGLCALVKIQIAQELTMERTGFLATLEITNNEGDANITDFAANLTFNFFNLNAEGVQEDATDLFFVQQPQLQGISGIIGDGIIRPGETARIEWFMIPKTDAGGTIPEGVRYSIGAELSGNIYGQPINPEYLTVFPDIITVLPEAQLDITYFMPRDVDGDDPFTVDVVEAPIPFTLGVLVKNDGFGAARKLKISSQQPEIVDNYQALILVPRLLGSRVDDEPTDQTSLTVDLGDIEPGSCRKGAWDMITTLSGQFIDFKASYTHADELGGEETSLIKDLNAYFIVHEVMNDQPGRDQIMDFLADTVIDESVEDIRAIDIIPDALYETDCNVLPVNHLTTAIVASYNGVEAVVDVTADFENWVYVRVEDPAQNKLPIASVIRSDGKVLNTNNYWTNTRYRFEDNARLDYLNLFDFVALGNYSYTVTYAPIANDTIPPETVLRFAGEVTEVASKFYIKPDTQLFFTVEDESPVAIQYRLDGGSFTPGLPFFIDPPGEYLVEYFSTDSANNEEDHKFATVVLSDDFPQVANLTTDGNELFITGQSLSVRPDAVTVSFDAANPAIGTDALVEVFRSVYGFATLGGVPSSPTTDATASLTVGGDNVDFYKYQLNAGGWSAEFPVAQALGLNGLAGAVSLEVRGRSQYGDYLVGQSHTVSWTVAALPEPEFVALVTGPMTPTRSLDATLSVPGVPNYCYRVDGTFYQPEASPSGSISLTDLAEGDHMVEVLSRADAASCPGDVPGTAFSWTIDRSYGFDLPAAEKVKETLFSDIGVSTVDFVWDGRDDGGTVVPPDWYTIKATLADALGRESYGLQLVEVGDLLADGVAASDPGAAPQDEPHAQGNWAVWQDQRNFNWDIYALNLADPGATAVQITSNALNQERPRTDGVYVVWEDKQADGNWDVWIKDLTTADPAASITATAASDETRPYVHWPWVVYQSRPVGDPDGPWQLIAYNLITATSNPVEQTSQDQLSPVVHNDQVVWEDHRDPGPGEIYYKDLRNNVVVRITNDPNGQIQPTIMDHWIVWADNRQNLQLDLYGFNLKRGVEVQLTDTPQDEARPFRSGPWVVYTDDSAGNQQSNLRLLHLQNLAALQLTNFESDKERPSMAAGKLIWLDDRSGPNKVLVGDLPDLQPVFDNRNTVAVTSGILNYHSDAYSLLTQWNTDAGITEITRYSALLPTPVAQTAVWLGSAASGVNFTLEAGSFLWVKFDSSEVLDLGSAACAPVDVAPGISALGYNCFPDGYSAYALINEIGGANINSVRVLDAGEGRWSVAHVANGGVVGENFEIPKVAVIMLDLNAAQSQWTPGGGL